MKIRRILPHHVALGAAAAVFFASCGRESGGESSAAGQKTLRFSAIPDRNTTELEAKFGALSEYLEETLGVPVEFVPSTDYEASVEMFKNGDIQLAWFGGLTGVQARRAVEGARAIAQGKADPEYYSYFIANASTGLERTEDFPEEIAGLKFTFGSPSSTSGRLMPAHFITEATGKKPEEFFEHPLHFSSGHDQTAILVESGQFEAGALNYAVYDEMVEEQKIDPQVCRIIWQTPTYADYNMTAHPMLSEMFGDGFIEKLQGALISIDDPAILAAFQREAIIPADDSEFANIERVAEDLGFLQ